MQKETLEKIKKYIFSTGIKDSGTSLCEANLQYGLAKIHFVQEQLGLKPDAFFIGTPDMTTPRYIPKWNWGLGIGGKLIWGKGKENLLFLDPQVSTSGVFVGELQTIPNIDQILIRIREVKIEELSLMGIPILWDFDRGNHFINIYQVKKTNIPTLKPFIVMLHGGDPELQKESPLGMGLHYDKSEALQRTLEIINTPFGPTRILRGKAVEDYYRFYQTCEEFSKKKRELIAERIFDGVHSISNVIHHGLINSNQASLGCYTFQDNESTLFPLTLRAELPAYLLRGKSNFSIEIIRRLGLEQQAEDCGVLEHLLHANLLPHGGGYTYPEIQSVEEVLTIGDQRYFLVSTPKKGVRLIHNVGSLPYQYRGLEVLEKILSLQMAEVVAELEPVCSFTI